MRMKAKVGKRRVRMLIRMGKDTDHSFYLLAGEVVNDGGAADLQVLRI